MLDLITSIYWMLSMPSLKGKSASIHYGTGSISGFFSQDNVKVGDLVVKEHVRHFLSKMVLIFLFNSDIHFLASLVTRILSRPPKSHASHSWQLSLMAFSDLDFKKYLLAMQFLFGPIHDLLLSGSIT